MRTEESKQASRYVQQQNSHAKLRQRINRLETLLGRAFYILHENPETSDLVQDIEYEITKCARRYHYWDRSKELP